MQHLLKYCILFCSLIFLPSLTIAQLSPGELTKAHANLEGLKNCTKCHVLGEKETTSKCLECHTEINQLINLGNGYHASAEVKGKNCAECHGEHFGRDFEIIRFDEKTFKHDLAGYKLEGKHTKIKCADCHKTEFIKNKISQKKSETFLGLGTECLSCHNDYHQNTLSNDCVSCHTQNAFQPASGFNHNNTKFTLTGAHKKVDCIFCHKIENQNGIPFQEFSGVAFENCTSCHEDVHNNKFGSDCRKCHTEVSFQKVKSLSSFNHEKTDYPLVGMHRFVDCKSCHKGSYTKAVKHNRCIDCHSDFHENQLEKNGNLPDCSECHSVETFSPSFYSIEKHNQTNFPLDGSHLATPCFVCHKTENKWYFGNRGTRCVDCHENIHENYLDEKYMPDANCNTCHSNSVWNEILFEHENTNFPLLGKHEKASCRDCHFKEDLGGLIIQQFKTLDASCENCHVDIHFKQFELGLENDCERCHSFNNWKPEKFNHNNARFKIDGEHIGLDCVNCHKPTDDLIQNYIVYKFEDITCASCH